MFENEDETRFQDAELERVERELNANSKEVDRKNETLEIGGVFLNRYYVRKTIGRGNTSVIYLVEKKGEKGAYYVLKEFFPNGYVLRTKSGKVILKPDLTKEEKRNYFFLKKIFLKEAQNVLTLSKEKHPNVIRAVKLETDINGTHYYLMEYVEGVRLKSYIEKEEGKLAPEDVIRIGKGILEGLEYIHKFDIFHQDIKLDNILIKRSGEPVLLDFGASVTVFDENTGKYYNTATLKYAAPEQINLKDPNDIGPETDIYNTGVLLYRLMVGYFPPKASERIDAIENGKTDPLKPLSDQKIDGYSKSAKFAVDKALRLKKSHRFSSAKAFKKAFAPEASRLIDALANKKILFVVSILALVAGLFFLAPDNHKTRKVIFDGNMSDVSVFVNGKFVNSEDNILFLKEGLHRIRMEKKGYDPYVLVVDLSQDKTIKPVFDRQARKKRVELISKTPDTRFFLDDKELKTDHFFIAEGERKKLTAKSYNYRDYSMDIDYETLQKKDFKIEVSLTPEVIKLPPIFDDSDMAFEEEQNKTEPFLREQEGELPPEPPKEEEDVRFDIPQVASSVASVQHRDSPPKKQVERKSVEKKKLKIPKSKTKKKSVYQNKKKKRKQVAREIQKKSIKKAKKKVMKRKKIRKTKKTTSHTMSWMCIARKGGDIFKVSNPNKTTAHKLSLLRCKRASSSSGKCYVNCFLER